MFKALKTFSGKISMKKGEVRDIKDKYIVNDLLQAGYIEKEKPATKKKSAKKKKVDKSE